jgi:hypothetical protein
MCTHAKIRRYLRRNIERYLEEHIAMPPRAVVLMATVEAAAVQRAGGDGQGEEEEAAGDEKEWLGRAEVGSSSGEASGDASSSSSSSTTASAGWPPPVFVGTAEVSFSPTTRAAYLTLNPPAVRCCC